MKKEKLQKKDKMLEDFNANVRNLRITKWLTVASGGGFLFAGILGATIGDSAGILYGIAGTLQGLRSFVLTQSLDSAKAKRKEYIKTMGQRKTKE